MQVKTKNILIGVGSVITLITGFIIYKKIKKQSDLNKDIKGITTGNIPKLGINIVDIAAQIGIEMGTAYPVYDPRFWTENDTKAKELILKVPKPLISNLISEYNKKYKRNLIDDLRSKLDDWNEVSYLFS